MPQGGSCFQPSVIPGVVFSICARFMFQNESTDNHDEGWVSTMWLKHIPDPKVIRPIRENIEYCYV
jgi:hypothetical protein